MRSQVYSYAGSELHSEPKNSQAYSYAATDSCLYICREGQLIARIIRSGVDRVKLFVAKQYQLDLLELIEQRCYVSNLGAEVIIDPMLLKPLKDINLLIDDLHFPSYFH